MPAVMKKMPHYAMMLRCYHEDKYSMRRAAKQLYFAKRPHALMMMTSPSGFFFSPGGAISTHAVITVTERRATAREERRERAAVRDELFAPRSAYFNAARGFYLAMTRLAGSLASPQKPYTAFTYAEKSRRE